MTPEELIQTLRAAEHALQDYERFTRGVLIPSTRVQGSYALDQIRAAIEKLRSSVIPRD